MDDGQDAEEVIRTAVVRWRDRLSSWPSPPELAADGHSLSAAAGDGLAVLRRLAKRSVVNRVPMKLDF